jgi:chromate transporter
MPTTSQIFLAFLHLGSTAFGGLAMIEPIRRRLVLQKKWLSQREFLDGLALCQLLPGATVVQLATYLGQRLRGTKGGLAAAGAFILPAFILMMALSALYFRYGDLPGVKAVSRGLAPVVIALLLQTIWQLGRGLRGRWLDWAIALLAFLALWLQLNYLLVLLLAVALGSALGSRLDPQAVTPGPEGPRAKQKKSEDAGLCARQGHARPETAAPPAPNPESGTRKLQPLGKLLTTYPQKIVLSGWGRPALGDRLRPLPQGGGDTRGYGVVLLRVVIFGLCFAAAVFSLFHLDRVLGYMSFVFIKIGCISFGGGYVMIPILQWEVVESLKWLTLRQFLDGILLSYITPGPLLILAAFVGFSLQGLPGALTASVSVFLPPALLVILLAPYYQEIKEARWMRRVIRGILAALLGFLALVLLQMGRAAITDLQTLGLMLAGAWALIVLEINLLWVIAGAAACSLLLFG